MHKLVISFTIFLILSNQNTVLAYCLSNGITVLNKSKQLEPEGLLALQFYGRSILLLPELGKKYQVFLKSNNEKIPLNAVKTFTGEGYESVVVFKVSSTLKVGKNYTLEITGLPLEEQNPTLYDTLLKKSLPYTFLITEPLVKKKYKRLRRLKEESKFFAVYGCGPEKFVSFSVLVEGYQFIQAKVSSLTTNKITEYIFGVKNGKINVGHDMCGAGSVLFENGNEYEISYKIFSPNNEESKYSPALKFTKPTELTKPIYE